MKLRRGMAVLAVLGVTSLVAADINSVGVLVDKIHSATDMKVKSQLTKELDAELLAIEKKDLLRAQEIVSNKLKTSEIAKNN